MKQLVHFCSMDLGREMVDLVETGEDPNYITAKLILERLGERRALAVVFR